MLNVLGKFYKSLAQCSYDPHYKLLQAQVKPANSGVDKFGI